MRELSKKKKRGTEMGAEKSEKCGGRKSRVEGRATGG